MLMRHLATLLSHLVELDELGGGGLEGSLDGGPGDDGLGHDALAPPVQPVDGRRLLVRAHVAAQRQDLFMISIAIDCN